MTERANSTSSTAGAGAATAVAAPPPDPRFVQRDPREIRTMIARLGVEERPLLVSFGGEGDVIHSQALGLSDDGRSVFLEWGPDDDTSRQVIDARTVSCQAELDSVRLHFALELRAGRLEYRKVFVARLPDLVFRVQRREYYRLPVEPTDGVVCRIALPQPGGPPRDAGVVVADLSGGGMAVRVPMALGAQLRLHVELGGCVLTLAEAGPLQTRVRVRNLARVVDDQGQAWVRVGLQFLDLRVGHIGQVQRFLGQVERRRRDEARAAAGREAAAARHGR